jgi:hypothetical protein
MAEQVEVNAADFFDTIQVVNDDGSRSSLTNAMLQALPGLLKIGPITEQKPIRDKLLELVDNAKESLSSQQYKEIVEEIAKITPEIPDEQVILEMYYCDVVGIVDEMTLTKIKTISIPISKRSIHSDIWDRLILAEAIGVHEVNDDNLRTLFSFGPRETEHDRIYCQTLRPIVEGQHFPNHDNETRVGMSQTVLISITKCEVGEEH